MKKFPPLVTLLAVVLTITTTTTTTTTTTSAFLHCTGFVGRSTTTNIKSFKKSIRLWMRDTDDDDDDDDDDDEIAADLGDWRKFRNSLLSTGLQVEEDDEEESSSTTPESNSSNDNNEINRSSSSGAASSRRPKSVAVKNEALLELQNEKLADEYRSGIWAHDIAMPEVGGLVCRMPFEVEMKNHPKFGIMVKELDMSRSGGILEGADEITSLYLASNKFIEAQLKEIMGKAEGETIDVTNLNAESLDFLEAYMHSQQTWQEVCLVINKDESSHHATETVVLNRPLATEVDEGLAEVMLYGAVHPHITPSQTGRLMKFLTAFGEQCPIYFGGPSAQSEPAIFLHGIQDLEGSQEISLGTGIYTGGLDAALEGINKGQYSPLEFRFFVGKHSHKNGELEKRVKLGQYQPVACARSLALKQCMGLPKPLWHEVLELIGGEWSEISSMELSKRSDLKD